MNAPFPMRPRLADHALLRRHFVSQSSESRATSERPAPIGSSAAGSTSATSNAFEETIVLHDTRTQQVLRLDPRICALLVQADGTRDLEGIALSAARVGALHRTSELLQMLEELHVRGLLVDGIDAPLPTVMPSPIALQNATPSALHSAAPIPIESSLADRPVVALPGYALVCDGSGTCCRQYGSIAFSPAEAARALLHVPRIRDGLVSADRVFLPLMGAVPPGPEPSPSAVAMVDGACSFLLGDGRCAIHAVAGAAEKPRPCAIYPATFVDDGREVRVSIKVECRCVVTSLRAARSEPDATLARTRKDLDPAAQILMVPRRIVVGPGVVDLDRRDYLAWCAEALTRLDDAPDPALFCFALADALDPDRGSARRITLFFQAFHARAVASANTADEWRSPRDAARRARRSVAEAAFRLVERTQGDASSAHDSSASRSARLFDRLPKPHALAVERFYLRATLFGHHLVAVAEEARALDRAHGLADALRDRGVRLLVARMIESSRDDIEGVPLVEMVCRGHGVERYVHEIRRDEV